MHWRPTTETTRSLPYFTALNQLLTLNGDGTGNENQADQTGDYFITPLDGGQMIIDGITFYYEAKGPLSFLGYGTSDTPLVNGFQILAETRGGIITDLTPGQLVVTTNTDWSLIGTTEIGLAGEGSATRTPVTVRGAGAFAQPYTLRSGEKLIVRCRDDLTASAVDIQVATVHGISFVDPIADPVQIGPADQLVDDEDNPLVDDTEDNFIGAIRVL